MRQRRFDVVVNSIIADLEYQREKEKNSESKALARIIFVLRTN
jgi:hypothetical protein